MITKGERTREKILQDAAEVYQRKGFAATSISDLLVVTGVTKGSLYFHFPGKDEIGLAVLNRARGFVGGCLFGNTALEASDTAPAFARVVKEVFAAWTQQLSATIARAQARGQVRADLPADELAEFFCPSCSRAPVFGLK